MYQKIETAELKRRIKLGEWKHIYVSSACRSTPSDDKFSREMVFRIDNKEAITALSSYSADCVINVFVSGTSITFGN